MNIPTAEATKLAATAVFMNCPIEGTIWIKSEFVEEKMDGKNITATKADTNFTN
jgi:hypothetical protein